MEIKELQSDLVQNCGVQEQHAAFAVEELVRMGDVIPVDNNTMVIDPEWLSLTISVVVSPWDQHFKYIRLGESLADIDMKDCIVNGEVTAKTIMDRLCAFEQE